VDLTKEIANHRWGGRWICQEPIPGLEVLLSARILQRRREQDFQSSTRVVRQAH